MKKIVMGVSYSYDSGAALLVDGEIVAAINEERLNRIKMYSGFPALAIAECLRIAGIAPDAVTDVAIGGRMNFLYEAGTESTSPSRSTVGVFCFPSFCRFTQSVAEGSLSMST